MYYSYDQREGFCYMDAHVSLGKTFDKDCKVTIDKDERARNIYIEVYAIKSGRTPAGNVTEQKVLLNKTTENKATYELTFNNTVITDPDDIVLHAYMSYSEEIVMCKNVHYYEQSGSIRGILVKNNKLAHMVQQTLFYDGQAYDMSSFIRDDDKESEVKMIGYGAYILVFPLNIYFNTVNPEDRGSLGQLYQIPEGLNIEYTLCDKYGKAIDAIISSDEPANPNNKQYWIDTSEEKAGLYRYSTALAMWVPAATSYISIKINDPNFGMTFAEGDAIHFDSVVEDIGEGSIIIKQGYTDTYGYIVVTGLLDKQLQVIEPGNQRVFERRIPALDYVTVANNRVWGCHYGIEGSEVVNEIHACKLGDPKNWYVFDGISTDSYTLSLGDEGAFSGAITYNGYPLFFKENVIYKIYGTYPAAFQLYTYDCRGAQAGSGNSIQILGEYVCYKSLKDVCIFNGESPTGVSEQLGIEKFDLAAAGISVNKYYISMRHKETGEYSLFVFDKNKNLWIREDDTHITQFASNKSGTLYGHNKDKIFAFEYAEEDLDEDEEFVTWEAVTMAYNYEYPDHTYLQRLTIRADIPFDAQLTVEISYDDGEWKHIKTLRGRDKVGTQSIDINNSRRCDHYRLRLSGIGDVKVYTLSRTFEFGEEENGFTNR